MIFKKMKTVGITALSCCLFALPLAAKADLTIMNNTNSDSTSVINNGPCSSILGSVGITKAHSPNSVPQGIMEFVCLANKNECKADIYMTSDCTGPVVARAVLDTASGIKVVENYNINNYIVLGSGFHIDIIGGPTWVN